jgi:hypothetical protein
MTNLGRRGESFQEELVRRKEYMKAWKMAPTTAQTRALLTVHYLVHPMDVYLESMMVPTTALMKVVMMALLTVEKM